MPEALLQLPWFLNPRPRWLPSAVMVCGAVLFAFSYARSFRSQQFTSLFGWWIFAGAYAALAYPWVVSQTDYLVGAIFLVGKWFQGVGTVTLYLRLRSTINQLRNRELPGGGRFLKKVALRLLLGLIMVVGATASLLLLLFGPVESSLQTEIAIVWTVIFLLTGTIGIAWRLRSVPSEMPLGMTAGLVILVGGSGIYGFQLVPDQLILLGAGGIVMTAGYIGAAALWVLKSSDQSPGGRYR